VSRPSVRPSFHPFLDIEVTARYAERVILSALLYGRISPRSHPAFVSGPRVERPAPFDWAREERIPLGPPRVTGRGQYIRIVEEVDTVTCNRSFLRS